MKTLLARWIAIVSKVVSELRRSLRDYQRREYAYISELEERSRGLRLYAAGRRESAAYTPEVPERWELTQITTGDFHENVKAA